MAFLSKDNLEKVGFKKLGFNVFISDSIHINDTLNIRKTGRSKFINENTFNPEAARDAEMVIQHRSPMLCIFALNFFNIFNE